MVTDDLKDVDVVLYDQLLPTADETVFSGTKADFHAALYSSLKMGDMTVASRWADMMAKELIAKYPQLTKSNAAPTFVVPPMGLLVTPSSILCEYISRNINRVRQSNNLPPARLLFPSRREEAHLPTSHKLGIMSADERTQLMNTHKPILPRWALSEEWKTDKGMVVLIDDLIVTGQMLESTAKSLPRKVDIFAVVARMKPDVVKRSDSRLDGLEFRLNCGGRKEIPNLEVLEQMIKKTKGNFRLTSWSYLIIRKALNENAPAARERIKSIYKNASNSNKVDLELAMEGDVLLKTEDRSLLKDSLQEANPPPPLADQLVLSQSLSMTSDSA